MIPVQTLEAFDIFGDPSSQVSPAPAKYAQGYLPGETLPAQHENFFLGKSSRCVTELRAGVTSIENELVNVVTAGGATPDESTSNQVLTAINYLISAAEARAKLAAHPVGSLFCTSETPTITVEGVEQDNPAGHPRLLFGGGTWTRVQDTLIWAKGTNATPKVGETDQLPIGTMLPYGGSNAPTNTMMCQYGEVNQTDFPDLYSTIGSAFGTASSGKFRVPDLKEAVPKGAGLSGKTTNHMGTTGLSVGEFIDDRLQEHYHQMNIRVGAGSATVMARETGNPSIINDEVRNISDNLSARKGTTTEVKSVGVNYIIKATKDTGITTTAYYCWRRTA